MWVCMQNDPANTRIGSIARSSASTDHTASTNTNHHSTGRYGIPGQRQEERAVRARQHGEYRGDREQERTTTSPQGHPEGKPHRHDVECDVGGEQSVRRAAEQFPYRPERVEAQRSGMTPTVRPERSDATGKTDERRVTRDVAHADLGLRHVEQRIPMRTPQLNERDHEREREDDHQCGEEQGRGAAEPAIRRQSARVGRRIDHDVVDHGSAFNTRSKPGRTGDW